jgi:predicted ABC-type transport system involved in lysophospholipase L1 biosynthesis ATPase subunit
VEDEEMKTVRKVRRIDEDADNAVINKKAGYLFKSIQILRKVKALKFEGTRQYK